MEWRPVAVLGTPCLTHAQRYAHPVPCVFLSLSPCSPSPSLLIHLLFSLRPPPSSCWRASSFPQAILSTSPSLSQHQWYVAGDRASLLTGMLGCWPRHLSHPAHLFSLPSRISFFVVPYLLLSPLECGFPSVTVSSATLAINLVWQGPQAEE